MSRAIRLLLAYLAAIAAAAVAGSVLQTQINLAALRTLGAEIDPATRLLTTGQDLLGFAPLWAAILALGFLIAFVCARILAVFLPARRSGLYVLAGTVSVFVTLWLMRLLLPITVIAATREPTGVVLIGLTGVLGGWVFARLAPPAATGSHAPGSAVS